ncbi:MAG TPA: STAS domain-containing protein [Actinomycetes bacterium]|nr:STAS domain-containing protein [Actinomycetes bacterium]
MPPSTTTAPPDLQIDAVPAPAGTTIFRADPDSLVLVIGPTTGTAQLSAAVTMLSGASHESCRRLILDVGSVPRLSSDVLALLLWANVRLRSRGATLQVARPSPATRDLLHRTGLDHVIPVLDQLPEGVAA